MYGKRGPSMPCPSAESRFQHDIDYAGLPRDVEDDTAVGSPSTASEPATPGKIDLQLTRALHLKLSKLAGDEGVSLEQLIQELLAEGATLRAWEVVERKSAMRDPGASQRRPSHGQGPQHHHNRRPPPGKGSTAWMEDKAAFLEYVRNQEKQGRR